MAQFARPDADQATGTWAVTPLWSKVEEGVASDDNTLITLAASLASDFADLRLSDVTDPASSTGHILRVDWHKVAGNRTINGQLELWQGVPGTGSLVATLTTIDPTADTDYTYTLTGTEADNITDYAALYLRVYYTYTGGGQPSSFAVDAVELETPDANTDRTARVHAYEFEVPNAPRTARVHAYEFEVPNANRRARVHAFEMEAPDGSREARVYAFEMEAPPFARTARVFAFEFEVPNAPRTARVHAFEFEVDNAPRRARVFAFEFETPNAPRRARVHAYEFETPNAPRRARVFAFEFEVDNAPRRARVFAFEFEVDNAPRRARVFAFEFEIPNAPVAGGRVYISLHIGGSNRIGIG